MERLSLLLLILQAVSGLNYVPFTKEQLLTDLLLKAMMERMGKDLTSAADGYLTDRLQSNNLLTSRDVKDSENRENSNAEDLEGLSNNPDPSLTDEEYPEHSSLWGRHFMAGDEEGRRERLNSGGSVQNQQQIKTLPAYCNPPNPCPFGYTVADDCLEEFENTAAFSRDYESSQDCMCDSEHMFECPVREFQSNENELNNDLDLNRIMEELRMDDQQHKNLVAKKFHTKKDSNPFLQGEKLPVAAKKGNNLICY